MYVWGCDVKYKIEEGWCILNYIWNIEKRVKNNLCIEIFLMNFKVFENIVEYFLELV